MKHKQILFFFPGNFFLDIEGCHFRVLQELRYLLDNNCKVDVLIFDNIGGWKYKSDHFQHENMNVDVINYSPILEKFQKILFFANINISFSPMAKMFTNMINTNKYDAMFISYAPYAYLARLAQGKVKKIICDTHDFLTLWAYSKNEIPFDKLGKRIGRELKYLAEFTDIINISEYENYFFESFLSAKNHVLVPYSEMFEVQKNHKYKYDLIFVGSDNVFNIISINWFLEKVYPKISNLKLVIVGKVGNHIAKKNLLQNVEIVGRVEKLDEYYHKSKVAISPMIGGTGLKIKIIEALSYGKPVIASSVVKYGLISGFENSIFLATDEIQFIHYLQKIESILINNNICLYRSKYSKELYNKTLEKILNT